MFVLEKMLPEGLEMRWVGDEKGCVGIGKSSELQGTHVPGEVPIWVMTEQYSHIMGGWVPLALWLLITLVPRVLGSIANFSEGIIFKVYSWILKRDPEILLCVGNSNAWVLEGADPLRGGSGLRPVASMLQRNDQSSFSVF